MFSGEPRSEFCAVTEPHYPKAGDGRRPVGLERILRMYFIATWFNLANLTRGASASRMQRPY